MQYVIVFLEGIITFVSPCLLPMLPVYLSYFMGGEATPGTGRTVKHVLGFVLGFTVIFLLFGAFAGVLGQLMIRYATIVNLVTGAIVVLFGLNYIGLLKLPFLNGSTRKGASGTVTGFFSAMLFGMVFSIGWTPCVGAFLGSALLLASQQGTVFQGMLMLLLYSLGLGVPFLLSALLLDKIRGAFDWIKKHYRAVNLVSGVFLVIVGVLMMTGLMGKFLSLLSA